MHLVKLNVMIFIVCISQIGMLEVPPSHNSKNILYMFVKTVNTADGTYISQSGLLI